VRTRQRYASVADRWVYSLPAQTSDQSAAQQACSVVAADNDRINASTNERMAANAAAGGGAHTDGRRRWMDIQPIDMQQHPHGTTINHDSMTFWFALWQARAGERYGVQASGSLNSCLLLAHATAWEAAGGLY